MIKDILRHKTFCRGVFMMAGLFVFLSTTSIVHGACTNGVDFSTAHYNNFFNATNYPNSKAFAALTSDGHIISWGYYKNGGTGEPTDAGYTQIYSTDSAFAALKSDGSITAWGSSDNGGAGAPSDTGYVQIFGNGSAFAALKSDGSITAWGNNSAGASGAPSDSGYMKVYSTNDAFAAIKSDGSITTWGNGSNGGSGGPSGDGYTEIYSNQYVFAALKSDGSITAWGDASYGGTGAPTDAGYTEIRPGRYALAALKSDGSITAWGHTGYGGSGAPTDSGYVRIFSTEMAFAAIKDDGSVTVWGHPTYGGSGAPTDSGYVRFFASRGAFAALKSDGSITAWGSSGGGSGAPTDSGYTQIYSNDQAFAALKSDGSITAWGSATMGGSGAPSDTDYIEIYSTLGAFAALKSDGSLATWGNSSYGSTGAPAGVGYTIPYGGSSCQLGAESGSSDITIPDPNNTKIQDAVTDGHVTVDNGTIDNTDQTTTQVNITFTSNTASALFPANTIITEQSNGNYNFQNFTIQDKSIQNTAAAIDLGIPGTDLSFSQDITLNLNVGDTYNDQTLNVYSQSTGQTDWTLHTTCTVSEGDCTFTTNHATIYTAGGIPGAMPIDINVEVQDTLTLDCFDTATGTGDLNVTLGTTTDPGKVTAGTPATGQSTCTVTTNDDQGYYLTLIDDNAATNTVLTHTDPHTGATYEIQDLTQFPATTTWTTPTTKGLGFSVVTFPDTQTNNNTLDETWTNTSLCPEGTAADTNTYAGIPDTAETISAVTQYESNQTTTNICYKVDVPASQASGQYTGSVTYTATSDASSYLN